MVGSSDDPGMTLRQSNLTLLSKNWASHEGLKTLEKVNILNKLSSVIILQAFSMRDEDDEGKPESNTLSQPLPPQHQHPGPKRRKDGNPTSIW